MGISFRQIANKILNTYIQPNVDEIRDSYQTMYKQARSVIENELQDSLFTVDIATNTHKTPLLKRIWPFASQKNDKAMRLSLSQQEQEFEIINGFKEKGLNADNALSSAVYRGLTRVLGSIANQRGYLGKDIPIINQSLFSNF